MADDWIAMPSLGVTAPMAAPEASADRRRSGLLVPHHETFASVWNRGLKAYWYRHDEALRKSYTDALAMRRDPVIHACLRRRQYPTSAIPYAIEPDDPTDPAQRVAARVLGRLIDAVPRFQQLKLSLLEAIFYGRAGVQVAYGPIRVDGYELVGVRDHVPVEGDKIVRAWGGRPGVLVGGLWASGGAPAWMRPHIRPSGHFGSALFLETRRLRERFLIHSFEPTDTDYLYEGDLAGAAYGMGLRSRLWFPWNLRNEIDSWSLDALQRIGTNGLMYGRYPSANAVYRDEVLEMIAKLTADHVSAVPYIEGQSGDEDPIRTIPVNPIGYDILQVFHNLYEGQIREIINGDNPAAVPSADTRKAAELTEDTRMSYHRADAVNLQETLTDQLVAPLVRMNRPTIEALTGRPVDYRLRLKLQIDRPNAIENLQAAQLLVGIFAAMGQTAFPIDPGYLVDMAGLRPPEGGTIGQEIRRIEAEQEGLAMPPPEPGMIPARQGQQPGGPAGGQGDGEPPPGSGAVMPTAEAPADGSPPDRLQNLGRPTSASQGGDPSRYSADGRGRVRYGRPGDALHG